MADSSGTGERRYPSGHTIRVREGHGRAVLFLNGCGLSSAGWDDVVAGLPGRRVITVDRPGHYGTVCTGPPSLAAETRFLAELIATEPGPAVVVAHSMASFQAEALARVRPALVSGVVLVDPSMPPKRVRSCAAAGPLSRLATRCLRISPIRAVAGRVLRVGMRRQTRRPEMVDAERWRPLWSGERELGAAASEWLSFRGQAAELAALRRVQGLPAPTTAVVLEALPFAGAGVTSGLASAFHSTRLRRLPECRHLVMLDAPGEVVREIELLG
ncbi:Pimeloyl-ACP methyl ester carboxylesterase [Actinomyces ruminicola]|uniref:Pimeloyl-ACP methyl ester carboxylesterase n=1 Tax=Actinomyces ruminicola TaxID=332524 RepID=A0A1H0CUE6_9ACTO|nr:Pimeloyl-ACP methyl ester carboxylesterase [Actinomyces ruminicola]